MLERPSLAGVYGGDQLFREFRMKVVECDVPSGSMLSHELIERAYFRALLPGVTEPQ